MGSPLLPAGVSAAVLTVRTDDRHGLSGAVRRERSSPILRYGGRGGGRGARLSLEGAWRSEDGRRCIDGVAREDGSVARTMLH